MGRVFVAKGGVALVALVLLAGIAASGCLDAAPEDNERLDATAGRFDAAARPAFVEGRAVVAVVDTGANPYHADFRREGRAPAAVLLPGYPADAFTLPLTLDAADRQAAYAADKVFWDLVEEERLYDVPGTAFVGLISFGAAVPAESDSARASGTAPGLDESGHGTASAGMVAAACPECLIVAVETSGAASARRALAWLAVQDWIDLVVYPARAGAGFVGAGFHATSLEGAEEYAWARPNAERGQIVVVSAGNGWPDVTQTGAAAYSPARDLSYGYWTAGPDWVLTVGAASAASRTASTWHTFPVDIVAEALACDAPHPFSLHERVAFEGTSCAAPVVAGQVGALIAAARDVARDGSTGPRSGQRLVVPEDIHALGATREDVTRAYLLTAGALASADVPLIVPDPLDPRSWATADGVVAPLYAGWGLHDDASLQLAVDVLTGAADAPAPSEQEARWFAVDQRVRLSLWGTWDRGTSRIGFPEPYAGAVKVPEDVTGLEALYVAAQN